MASFQTHVTTSLALGTALGSTGYWAYQLPASSCLLAGGMCGVAGMLPDVDSDNGIPLRESMAFLAAILPMTMLDRLRDLQLGHESMIVVAGSIYILVRFALAEVIRLVTVHRGMWHSLPAAATAGLLSFYLCRCDEYSLRMFKVCAVIIGYCSHLILDELNSLQFSRGRWRFKQSLGTAFKFWGKNPIANATAYGLLLISLTLVVNEPIVQNEFRQPTPATQNPFPSSAIRTTCDCLVGV